MGRSNRRKKIAKLLRKAKKRREEEAKKMADPTTVAGQSLCTIEDLEKHDRDTHVLRQMMDEEVIIPKDLHIEQDPPRSWWGAMWGYVFAS